MYSITKEKIKSEQSFLETGHCNLHLLNIYIYVAVDIAQCFYSCCFSRWFMRFGSFNKKIHTFLVTIKPKNNKFEEMILIEIVFLF